MITQNSQTSFKNLFEPTRHCTYETGADALTVRPASDLCFKEERAFNQLLNSLQQRGNHWCVADDHLC